jgi:hypothetical protein
MIYGSAEGADDYHADRGNVRWIGDESVKLAALLRASEYIDGYYSELFIGSKAGGREQEREWPRLDAIDSKGEAIADDAVPVEIERATYEIALRELVSPGVMFPTVNRSDRKAAVAVSGAVSVTYAPVQSIDAYRPVVTIVDAILAPVLVPRSQNLIHI